MSFNVQILHVNNGLHFLPAFPAIPPFLWHLPQACVFFTGYPPSKGRHDRERDCRIVLTFDEKLYTQKPKRLLSLSGGTMYEIMITRSFSAAHMLKDIGGKCEALHGHNFTVEVSLAAPALNKEGLLLDFRILKEWTDEILDSLDHKHLNELPYFKSVNPSAENIARFLHDRLSEKACEKNLDVSCVTVWESGNARASYRGKPT